MYDGPRSAERAILTVTGSVLPTREALQVRARHEPSQEGVSALRNSHAGTMFEPPTPIRRPQHRLRTPSLSLAWIT